MTTAIKNKQFNLNHWLVRNKEGFTENGMKRRIITHISPKRLENPVGRVLSLIGFVAIVPIVLCIVLGMKQLT